MAAGGLLANLGPEMAAIREIRTSSEQPYRSCWKVRASDVFFQNAIISFLDSLTQQIIFLIIKINNFWGDQSGISAKTATLVRAGSAGSLVGCEKSENDASAVYRPIYMKPWYLERPYFQMACPMC